jgi:phytoene dehydrogenase-like protein
LYEEVGAAEGRKFVSSEELMRIEGDEGQILVLYTNSDKLEEHMKALSPEDGKTIKEFTSLIRHFKRFNPPLSMISGGGVSLRNFKDVLKVLPFARIMSKYGKVSVAEFAAKFKHPFLRQAFMEILIPQMSVMSAVLILAMMDAENAGYPIGGSLEFSKAIESRYFALGGKIHYGSKVEKIIVENDRAVGVRVSEGLDYKFDVVISAADGHSTIFDMLDGKYVDEEIKGYYHNLPVFDPIVYVSLGVAMDLSVAPVDLRFRSNTSVKIGDVVHHKVGYTIYSFDPTLAPPEKAVVVSIFPTTYEYWKKLSANRQRYDSEKERIAQEVIVSLETKFPGLSEEVEVVDVATPITFERYTGNWKGAYEGWLPTTENYGKTLKNRLPGLENFYLIGQWTVPGGGVPIAIISGRQVISDLCKQKKKRFVTRKAQ